MAARTKTPENTRADEVIFGKETILSMKRYASRYDLLSVLLDNEKTYTLDEADKLINKFMKGTVK